MTQRSALHHQGLRGIPTAGTNHAEDMARHQASTSSTDAVIGALTVAGAQPPAPPSPVVPGLGDTGVVLIGTVLCLLVIYAIVAAHLRKEDVGDQ